LRQFFWMAELKQIIGDSEIVQIDLYYPLRQCATCSSINDDLEQIFCSSCDKKFSICYNWNTHFANTIENKDSIFIFLIDPIFTSSDYLFPRRMLHLKHDQTVAALEEEENYLLEEVDYWKNYVLQKGDLKSILQINMKWKNFKNMEKNSQIFENFKKDKSECLICGEIYNETLSKATHLIGNTHLKEIIPQLYLGAQWNASCERELKYFNIEAIVNCAIEIKGKQLKKTVGPHYKHLQWDDQITENIFPDLEPTVQWIKRYIDTGKKILIHCAQGRSRSVSLIIAYLIQYHQWTYEKSLKWIKKFQPSAKPNESFIQQLLRFEKANLQS